ncbi:OLC1v1035071C1 [Oldenlandia corymbosa var. corymbosa]|uniref:OLC1v1035071C1 n=1 Tax=Oldenlandia corymbosa var. corymbosa TaxID=529605 RepID=A0AAV1CVC9_OLDCO|nr:OLC1v1035071C1 [Oldenlandia corymbosa var. corymbosa]
MGPPNTKSTRNRSSPSAAAVIVGNDDLLIELLLYLPTKALIRFKSVSKRWFSLISSSHFCLLHTRRHRPTTAASALCLRKSPSDFYILPLFTKPSKMRSFKFNLTSDVIHESIAAANPNFRTKILQSCNGLFLLKVPQNTRNLPGDYYVYNPATHQNRFLSLNFLPQNNSQSQRRQGILGINLAYDPSNSLDYKIICVYPDPCSLYVYQVAVYDSKIQSWKLGNGAKSFLMPYDVKFCDGVYWNGKIHWIREKGRKLYHFDVDKDSVGRSMRLPWEGRWRGDHVSDTYYFGNSNGHLHFITMYLNQSSDSELRIFEMEDDCSGWSLRYRVDFNDIVYAYPEMRRREVDLRYGDTNDSAISVLGVVTGENGDSLLVFHVPGKVVAYKLKDKSFVDIVNLRRHHFSRKGLLKFGCYDAYEFIETLAPV